MRKNTTTSWVPHSYSLSADAELDLVDIIHKGAKKSRDSQAYKDAKEAVGELVEAYSPFIEKVARERAQGIGHYGFSFEDILGEAYLAAIQCAWTFNPYKSATPIRFPSYASRAMNSSLSRMVARTRSSVSIPVAHITRARQWSHTYLDLVNKGIVPTDSDVSEMCGIEMSFGEVYAILSSSHHGDISEAYNIGALDSYSYSNEQDSAESVISAINKVCGADSLKMLLLFGVSGEVLITPYMMARGSDGRVKVSEAKEFFAHKKDYYTLHPRARMAMKKHLEDQ